MLRKIKVTALSGVFLLYAFGLLQAASLYILPGGNDAEPAQPFVQFSTGNKTQTNNSRTAQPLTQPTNSRRTGKPRKPSGPQVSAVSKKQILRDSSAQKFLRSSRTRKLRDALAIRYTKRTGKRLVITDSRRTPARQAALIRKKARTYGVRYVTTLYRNSSAIREIMTPYRTYRHSPLKAQREMTRVIQSQVARGIYVSNHLRGLAVDVRSRGRGAARLSILRQVARSLGGSVSIERDHYHVELT